jgi:hypothetical protein
VAKRKNRIRPVEWPTPPRYQEWLSYVFDRPDTLDTWCFDFELPMFEANEIEQAELIANTLEHCGCDLAKFSERQVNFGLEYIFNNSCSDVVFALMNESVPMQLRLRAIGAIKTLYRDCFTSRCAPVLGHLDEPGANILNHVCYMLWDASPLSYWENRPNREVFYGAVVDVLEEALTLPNPACVESALHGLGHLHSYCLERVEEVIGTYLRRNVFVAPGLQWYAQQAGVGRVQ